MPNDAAVIESNDATGTEPKDVLVAKRRSGSETRRRTDRLNLRLLPQKVTRSALWRKSTDTEACRR
jgi:hypothetical protein